MMRLTQKRIAAGTDDTNPHYSVVREPDFFNANGLKVSRYTVGEVLTKLSVELVFNTYRGYAKPLLSVAMVHVCFKQGIPFALSPKEATLFSDDFIKIAPKLREAIDVLSKKMGLFVSVYKSVTKEVSDDPVLDIARQPALADFQHKRTPVCQSHVNVARSFFEKFEPVSDAACLEPNPSLGVRQSPVLDGKPFITADLCRTLPKHGVCPTSPLPPL